MSKLSTLVKRILSYLPSKLPVGLPQMEAYLDSVVDLVGNIADPDSIRWVVCNEIMRLKSTQDTVRKSYFVNVIRKYAANQLAAHIVNELKAKQAAQQEAAKLQQAEAAAAETSASGEAQTE